MQLKEQDKSILEKEQDKFIPWESLERVKPPWVLEKHGERVLPQNRQKSNQKLTNEQVLQPRDEKIGMGSYATPLAPRNMESDEHSGRKRVGLE